MRMSEPRWWGTSDRGETWTAWENMRLPVQCEWSGKGVMVAAKSGMNDRLESDLSATDGVWYGCDEPGMDAKVAMFIGRPALPDPPQANNAPVVAILTPATGSTVNPTVTLNATVTDEESLTPVVTVGGSVVSGLTWVEGSVGSMSITATISLSIGANTVEVTATDSSAEVGAASVVVTRNAVNNPPVVTISSPSDATTTSNTVALAASVVDELSISSGTVTVNGVEVVGTSWVESVAGTVEVSGTVPLSVGANAIVVSVSDSIGQPGQDTFSITRAVDDPPLVVITEPAPEAVMENEAKLVTLGAVVMDDIAVDPRKLTVLVDSNVVVIAPEDWTEVSSQKYVLSTVLDIRSLPMEIEVEATDGAGQTTRSGVTIR